MSNKEEDIEFIERGRKQIRMNIDGENKILDILVSVTDLSNHVIGNNGDKEKYFVYFEGVHKDKTIMQNAFDGNYSDGKLFYNKKDAYGYANKIIRDGLVYDNGKFFPSPDTIIVKEKKINENLSAILSVLENN